MGYYKDKAERIPLKDNTRLILSEYGNPDSTAKVYIIDATISLEGSTCICYKVEIFLRISHLIVFQSERSF